MAMPHAVRRDAEANHDRDTRSHAEPPLDTLPSTRPVKRIGHSSAPERRRLLEKQKTPLGARGLTPLVARHEPYRPRLPGRSTLLAFSRLAGVSSGRDPPRLS